MITFRRICTAIILLAFTFAALVVNAEPLLPGNELPAIGSSLKISAPSKAAIADDAVGSQQPAIILTNNLFLTAPTDPVYVSLDGNSLSKHDRELPAELIAAGLLMLPFDKTLVRNINRTPTDDTSDILTETFNSFGKELLLAYTAAMYLTGNHYDKESAKVTGTGMIYALALTTGMKSVIHRDRPYLADDNSGLGTASITRHNDSFPSGHTALAFSAATVLAHRYPKRKWIYYAVAAGVGFARIRKSEHYPSDVLVGAGIGVYSGNIALRNGTNVFGIKF